ncbi:MAG: hypothetical protein H7Z20_02330 [Bdellovibrio sp.]|nr:hypothetical protein [Methylotenera sp.]
MTCTHNNSYTIVCCHLNENTRLGEVFMLPKTSEDPAQVWCSICENARIADEGWYDASDAVACWSLSCEDCVAVSLHEAREVILVDDIATHDAKPS